MSGHITRMSRGSRRAGRSGEQAEQHLAQHLHLTGRAVAGVHLDASRRRVEGARGRVDGGVGGDVLLQPGRAGCPPSVVVSRRSAALARLNHRAFATGTACAASSRRSRPSEASNGWPTRRWESSSARAPRPPGRRASPRAPRRDAGSHRWTSRCSPSAASSSTSVTGDAGVPEQREPRRQVDRRPGRSRSASTTRAWRCRGVGSPTSAASRRQSSGCQVRSAGRARPPAPSVSSRRSQSASRVGRCTAYDANSRASRRATA